MTDLVEIPSAPAPSDEAVRILEETLEIARAGRISSVAIAVVYRDGSTGDAWSKPAALGTLIGAVAVLQARLVDRITRKDP